jgi:hypothetical protein
MFEALAFDHSMDLTEAALIDAFPCRCGCIEGIILGVFLKRVGASA